MKYLYFDLIGGISGDMVVASLLDLAGDLRYLNKELKKINLGKYKIRSFKRQSGHVRASCFEVEDLAEKKRVFQFGEIKNKVNNSRLKSEIKKNILGIYNALYGAEKKAHGLSHAHFQQLGEIDCIIDISSACILIDKLRVGGIFYSSVPFGEKIAPATTHLLKSKNIYLSQHQYENITPTGIAIVVTLGCQPRNESQKDFVVQDAGYGAGSIQIGASANVLRAVLLEERKSNDFEKDEIVIAQCNIDDMSPQILGFLMDKLYEAGALEVYFETCYTKKSRVGILISVLLRRQTLDTIADVIFKETTTLGIRYFKADRLKLKRRERILKTSLGRIRIKEVGGGKYKKTIPEYDDCVKIAKSENMALKDVFKNFSGGK